MKSTSNYLPFFDKQTFPITGKSKAIFKDTASVYKSDLKLQPVDYKNIIQSLSTMAFNLGSYAEVKYDKITQTFRWDHKKGVRQKEKKFYKKGDKTDFYWSDLKIGKKDILEKAIEKVYFRQNKPHPALKNHIDQETAIGIYQMSEGHVLGGTFWNTRNVVCFDIDCHDGDIIHTKKNLINLFKVLGNPVPLLLNDSELGGYHIYFKLDNDLTYNTIKKFVRIYNDTFKDKHFKIESPAMIMLPYNARYDTLDLKTEEETQGYFNQTFDRFHWHPNDVATHINTHEEWLKKPVAINTILEFIGEPELTAKDIQKEIQIFARQRKITAPTQGIQKKYDAIEIYAHHRYHEMYQMVSYGKKLHKTESEILNDIRERDTGSRDLAKWSDNTLLQKIEEISQWMSLTNNSLALTDTYNPDYFLSNLDLVPAHIQVYFKSQDFLNKVLYNLGLSAKNTKWKTKHCQAIPLLAIEIIGKMIYDEGNTRKVIFNSLRSRLKKDLEVGSQFSEKFLTKFKKHYGFSDINIISTFKAIMNTDIFNQHYSNTRGWFYSATFKVCKQFTLFNGICKNIVKNLFSYIQDIKKRLVSMFKLLSTTNKINIQKVFKEFKWKSGLDWIILEPDI